MAFLSLLQSCGEKVDVQDKMLPPPNAQNLDPEKRIAYLTEMIDEEDLAPLHYERARLYLTVNRTPAALRDINRALSLDRNNAEYYVVKAKADFFQGNTAEAMQSANFALNKGINSLELNLLLGKLYKQIGNEVESLRYLQKVLVKQPNNYNATFLCGKIYANQNDTAASFQYLRKAIELAPQEKEPYNTFIALLNEYEEYEQALDISEKYLKNNEPDAKFSYYLGALIEQRGMADSAIYWFEKSYTEDAHWQPGIKIARYRMKSGDFTEANRLYEKVLEQNPAIENGYYELGYLNEYVLGDLDRALEAYQKGLEFDTLNNRYPYYINRVNRKIEFQNL